MVIGQSDSLPFNWTEYPWIQGGCWRSFNEIYIFAIFNWKYVSAKEITIY